MKSERAKSIIEELFQIYYFSINLLKKNLKDYESKGYTQNVDLGDDCYCSVPDMIYSFESSEYSFVLNRRALNRYKTQWLNLIFDKTREDRLYNIITSKIATMGLFVNALQTNIQTNKPVDNVIESMSAMYTYLSDYIHSTDKRLEFII